jgi:hypothetical protein
MYHWIITIRVLDTVIIKEVDAGDYTFSFSESEGMYVSFFNEKDDKYHTRDFIATYTNVLGVERDIDK